MDGIVNHETEPHHAYRYNGKELDEVSQTYEYGFRYYDPTIGRFTGVDPIASQFAQVSPFNYVLNIPNKLIDPDGLAPQPPNDYFDKQGNYRGSDNRGNDIRIITNSKEFSLNSKESALNNSKEIDAVYLSENAVGKIGDHYLAVLGRSDLKSRGKVGAAFEFMAVTQGNGEPGRIRNGLSNFKNPVISISLSGLEDNSGKIIPNLRDINNFLNTLYHETLHFNLFEDLGNGNFRDVVPKGDYWELSHVHMHNMQILHSSWEGTTNLFKRNHAKITRNNIRKIKNPKVFDFANFSTDWVKKILK